jgi:hypothetical protein
MSAWSVNLVEDEVCFVILAAIILQAQNPTFVYVME